jgi:hypothetical protein
MGIINRLPLLGKVGNFVTYEHVVRRNAFG